MNLSSRWDDLMPRMMSALAMVVVGGSGLALGGVWLAMLLSLVCGVMIWEAINLLAPAQRERAIGFAGVVGGAFFIATWLPVFSAVILMTVSVAAAHRMLAMQSCMLLVDLNSGRQSAPKKPGQGRLRVGFAPPFLVG
ncbi:MAG: hypothetical protein ACKVLN_04495 [Rhodobacterales bacterium]